MIKDVEALVNNICKQIRERTDIAVIGMSGGADSTLVACLCREALGRENVVGVQMPYGEVDLSKFNANSQKVINKLKIRSEWFPITEPVDKLSYIITTNSLCGPQLSQINAGNMRSRMRMLCLYATSHIEENAFHKRARVVGTGNLSEDFIGYDTKGGDSLCDFFPIGQLFKSEVYQMLEYFRDKGVIDEEMIDRVPSAGLWNGQTDEGELGHTYNEMEASITRCMNYEVDVNNPIDMFV